MRERTGRERRAGEGEDRWEREGKGMYKGKLKEMSMDVRGWEVN